MYKAVVFCPVTCLRRFVIKRDQESEMLKGCFSFRHRSETRMDWVRPRENHSFYPATTVSVQWVRWTPLWTWKSKWYHWRNEADLSELSNILKKPVLMCVTRRHHCPNAKTLLLESEKNFSSLSPVQRELSSMNGFDIDFAVIFPPGVLKENIDKSLKITQEEDW